MRIALIGGGSIGTSFLLQFVRSGDALHQKVVVDIYDPVEKLGPGEPYALEEPEWTLLNAPSFAMSAIASNKAHFLDWIKDRDPTSYARGSTAFLPRRVYGRYLEAMMEQARTEAARRGWEVNHIRTSVLDIVRIGDAYRIVPQGGAPGMADAVVLCIGNQPAGSVGNACKDPAFIASAYPTSQLSGIGRHEHVAVLGTSLSAVDVIVALHRRGHQGPIRATSRRGRLPAVRVASTAPIQLSSLGADNLRRVAADNGGHLTMSLVRKLYLEDFFRNGGREDEWSDATRQVNDPIQFLTEEIDYALTRPRVWLNLAMHMTGVIDLLWSLLDDAGREDFLAEFNERWVTRRVTFPVENARILLKMLRDGQLSIGSGLTGVAASNTGVGLQIEEKSAVGERRAVRVDKVVNATGFGADAASSTVPLIANLLGKGLAAPYRFGGLVVDRDSGCLCNASGAPQDIGVLGSLASGTYFWTNSMDMNARLAARHVEHLIRRFGPSRRAAFEHEQG